MSRGEIYTLYAVHGALAFVAMVLHTVAARKSLTLMRRTWHGAVAALAALYVGLVVWLLIAHDVTTRAALGLGIAVSTYSVVWIGSAVVGLVEHRQAERLIANTVRPEAEGGRA